MTAWLAFSAFEEAKLIECAERIEYTPLAAIGRFLPMPTVSLGLWIQPVDATHWLNL
jgi:hypothetical protein